MLLWIYPSLVANASRRGAVRPVGAYFPDNDRRSIHYPLHNEWQYIIFGHI